MTSTDVRASFDIEVTFHNGGGLSARGFRLDVPSADITDEELADLFVRELGLLRVDQARLSNRTTIHEPHKGLRTGPEAAAPGGGRAGREPARLVELSHDLRDGMITYPGLPAPEIGVHLSREDSRAVYAQGTEFEITRIAMVANTGTYLDAPAHRFAEGADLAGVPLERLVDLPGLVVRVEGNAAIDRRLLVPYDVAGCAVLLHTGWDRHWGTPEYGIGHPFLTADGADWLVESGAALVGIDSLNIDDTGDQARSAHTALLRAGIPIVEHMTGLGGLPPLGFRFHAAPPRVVGMGTFPVRAYAVVG